MLQGGHRRCEAAAGAGRIPKAPRFGQGKGRLCRMSQPSGSGASWGCGGVWGCFSCRERRAGTFRLHSGLGGTGKCHAAKGREGRQQREIWPGRTRPVSEIISRRSDAAGRIRDASLSERSRPRSPPSIWQQRMRVMGESPGWKGRRGGNTSPPLAATTFRAALPLSHPPRPSPKPRQTGPRLPGMTPAHCRCSWSCMAPPEAGTQRKGHLGTHHPKKRQKPRLEAALPQGRCQHSRDREVPHW